MRILFTTFILLLFASGLGAQMPAGKCECASPISYSSNEDVADLFPPALIKANGYQRAILTYDSVAVVSVTFNAEGYALQKVSNSGQGVKLVRDTNNNVIRTESLNYQWNNNVWDYVYKDKLLVKGKLRKNGKVVKDEDTEMLYIYEYKDTLLVKEKMTLRFSGIPESNTVLEHTYNAHNKLASTKVLQNGKWSYTIAITYDAVGNKVEEKSTFNDGKERVTTYTYEGNKLNSVKKTNVNAGECPERGTLLDIYYYNAKGLIEKFDHTYDGTKCILKVKYK